MKKQTYLCVDLHTESHESMEVNKAVKGSLVMTEEGDQFTFVETSAPGHVDHPELHWRLLDRSKHGRVTINSRHVKVEFYIHHDEYSNGNSLADMLASEIETLGENLSEMDLEEEVAKCHC